MKKRKPKRKPKHTGWRDDSERSLEMNDLRFPKVSEGEDDKRGCAGKSMLPCKFSGKSGIATQTPDVTGWGVATRSATSGDRASNHSPGRVTCHRLNRADATKEESEETKCKQ